MDIKQRLAEAMASVKRGDTLTQPYSLARDALAYIEALEKTACVCHDGNLYSEDCPVQHPLPHVRRQDATPQG